MNETAHFRFIQSLPFTPDQRQKTGLPALYRMRHSTGYYLANRGYDTRLVQDYLGHKNIAHAVRYTRTAAVRFEGLWR